MTVTRLTLQSPPVHWRPVHLAFALFQIVWLNVVVPGHTRGAVTLAGAGCPDQSCTSTTLLKCCPTGGRRHPTPAQQRACAICFFAAHLNAPPAIDCALPPLHLLRVAADETAEALIARDAFVPFHSRGPPAGA